MSENLDKPPVHILHLEDSRVDHALVKFALQRSKLPSEVVLVAGNCASFQTGAICDGVRLGSPATSVTAAWARNGAASSRLLLTLLLLLLLPAQLLL